MLPVLPAGKAAQGLANLSRLLASAAQLLPPAQRALHILEEGGTRCAPGLRLSAGAAAGEATEAAAHGRSASLPIVTGEACHRCPHPSVHQQTNLCIHAAWLLLGGVASRGVAWRRVAACACALCRACGVHATAHAGVIVRL